MGAKVRPAIKQALKNPPSLEARRRCEALLTTLGKGEMRPEDLRIQRVVETLQLIGTSPAQKLLNRFFPI